MSGECTRSTLSLSSLVIYMLTLSGLLLSCLNESVSASFTSSPPPLRREQRNKAVSEFETSLLQRFGLTKRPRPPKDILIPQYMIDLYRAKTNDYLTYIPSSIERRDRNRARGRHLTANTVRSFYHEDTEHTHGCPKHQCTRMWFNVSNIPQDEALTSAELRVFVERYSSEDASRSELKHKLEVYEIMKPVVKDVEPIARLVDVQNVVVQNSTWFSMDVHPAVLKWMRKPRVNHGLEIRLLPSNPAQQQQQSRDTPLKHVRLRRSAGIDDETWGVQKPLLVTYTNDSKSRTKRSSNRDKRNNKKNRRRRKKNRRKKNKPGKRRKQKNLCRRQTLYVNFSDVGWDDWIVAPEGYHAYFCDGMCLFPLTDNLNTTNHAIVQTLANSVDSRAAPMACCVPTSLSSISMLYMDENDRVVLKDYDDMVVEGCGCR